MLNKSSEAAVRGPGDPGHSGTEAGGGRGPAVQGGGEPFVFSQVQLLHLNRWHPIGSEGRVPDAPGYWAGAGSFADMCHSLPRLKQKVDASLLPMSR